MANNSASNLSVPTRSAWRQAVAGYQSPDLRRSLRQLFNTFVPYIVLWYLMVRSLEVSYWLTLPLLVVASGFLVRIFIFFHDAGHGSFFKSQRANDILGIISGILTFTPYYAWRHGHALHHASAGDLDRRGDGDIWTLTVKEYREASIWKRIAYRVFRFPLITFLIGPTVMFLIVQRIPSRSDGPRERNGVWATNLALLGLAAGMSTLIGFKQYLIIQIPLMMIAGLAGVWMFYVQHQFANTYWAPHDKWDFAQAALQGSSYYKLPRILQWFTGNIGFHHIHHLSPKIPNYKLQPCFAANPVLQQCQVLTFWSSLKTLGLHLWDEERQKLVGFGALKAVQAQS